MTTDGYDVIVIGAGHNGLICAAYLAKAGLKVVVFEQWHKAGGCVQTEELIPNFQITPCSVDHIMIQATPILKELELESRFGLKYLKVDPIFSVPFPDGKCFFIHEDLKKTCDSIAANISARDAENYNNFVRFWMKGFGAVRPLLTGPLYPLKDAILNLSHGERKEILRFVMKESDTFSEFIRTIIMSPRRLLDTWFETEEVKAPIAWVACNFGLPPSQSGMGLMTSFPMFTHIAGCKRPEGGSGMLSQALVRLIEHYGGTVKVEAPVKKVIVDDGRAKGIILENGETVEAGKAVISAMSPKRLFCDMIDADAIPQDLLESIEKVENGVSAGFKVDLALDSLPKFKTCGSDPNITIASPMICPSIDYLEKAYDEMKYGEPPKNPCFWSAVPTTIDPTLAPEGKHILYLYGIAPRVLSEGRDWEDVKEGYAETIIDKMEEYIPDLRKLIIGRYIASPDDLKKRIGDTCASHVDSFLDQHLIFRPTRKLSGYKTPVKGLFVTGSGTPPGGGVGGTSGRNAAQIVLQELKGKVFGRDTVKYGTMAYEIISTLLSGKSKS